MQFHAFMIVLELPRRHGHVRAPRAFFIFARLDKRFVIRLVNGN